MRNCGHSPLSGERLKIYLSGPIMDEFHGGAREWREQAKKLLGARFFLLDPMRRKFVDRQVDRKSVV